MGCLCRPPNHYNVAKFRRPNKSHHFNDLGFSPNLFLRVRLSKPILKSGSALLGQACFLDSLFTAWIRSSSTVDSFAVFNSWLTLADSRKVRVFADQESRGTWLDSFNSCCLLSLYPSLLSYECLMSLTGSEESNVRVNDMMRAFWRLHLRL